MRCTITFFGTNSRLTFPISYNSLIQGFIYKNIDKVLSSWLHNEALRFEKRYFRFFTFSRLMGRYKLRFKYKTIEFLEPVKLCIGSIHNVILESLVENLLKKPSITVGEEVCEIQRVEVDSVPSVNGPVLVKTLSPITTYSTLRGADGKKKTYYYTPFEKDWEEKLLDNIKRKARALGWDEKIPILDGAFIKAMKVSNRDLKIVYYRDTVIKAWTGIYEVYLPEPFFTLAYDSGLGAKNSQGFGMIKVVSENKRHS